MHATVFRLCIFLLTAFAYHLFIDGNGGSHFPQLPPFLP